MKSSKAFYEEGANMNKIFKVVWSKVRNAYVVVSEIAKNTVSGVGKRNRIGKVSLAATLAAVALTSSFFLPSEGLAAVSALTDSKPVYYIAIGNAKTNVNPFGSGSIVYNRQTGERYIEVVDGGETYKYIYTSVSVGGQTKYYWIREGFGVKAITERYHPEAANVKLDLYKIPGTNATYDNVAMSGEHSMVVSNVETAINKTKLDSVQYIQYAALSNSDGTGVPITYSYYIKRGEEYVDVGGGNGTNLKNNFYVFKDSEFNTLTGKYTFKGKDVEYDNVYNVGGKVGVFLTTSVNGVYDSNKTSNQLGTNVDVYGGTVYGLNNEVLLSGYNNNTKKWSTVWAAEITDPHATVESMTLGEFNEIMHHLHEEDVKLANEGIVKTKITSGVNTHLAENNTITNGGSINLLNKAGNQVPGFTMQSLGGTGGNNNDTYIRVKDSDGNYFDLKTGTVVVANDGEQYKTGDGLTSLTVNGNRYTISGGGINGDTTEIAGYYKPIVSGENQTLSWVWVNGNPSTTLTYGDLKGADGADGTDGIDGDKGADGGSVFVSKTVSGRTTTLVFTNPDGTEETVELTDGQMPPEIVVGRTYTVEAKDARVEGIWNDSKTELTLDFYIPQAADGAGNGNASWNLKVGSEAEGYVVDSTNNSVTLKPAEGEGNLSIVRNNGEVSFAMSKTPSFDSVTIGSSSDTSKVVINDDGVAMSNQKITGLAEGTTTTDAVNFGQLEAVKTALKSGDLHLVANPDVTGGKYTVTNNSVTLKVQGKDAAGNNVTNNIVIDDVASAEQVANNTNNINSVIGGNVFRISTRPSDNTITLQRGEGTSAVVDSFVNITSSGGDGSDRVITFGTGNDAFSVDVGSVVTALTWEEVKKDGVVIERILTSFRINGEDYNLVNFEDIEAANNLHVSGTDGKKEYGDVDEDPNEKHGWTLYDTTKANITFVDTTLDSSATQAEEIKKDNDVVGHKYTIYDTAGNAVVLEDVASAEQVATNTGNIATNAGNISKLDERVTVNEGNIATNTSAITALEGRVTVNEGNIATNASAITALEGRVTVNEDAIELHETNIVKNANDITDLKNRVTVDEGNITTNRNNITALDTRVTYNYNNSIKSIDVVSTNIGGTIGLSRNGDDVDDVPGTLTITRSGGSDGDNVNVTITNDGNTSGISLTTGTIVTANKHPNEGELLHSISVNGVQYKLPSYNQYTQMMSDLRLKEGGTSLQEYTNDQNDNRKGYVVDQQGIINLVITDDNGVADDDINVYIANVARASDLGVVSEINPDGTGDVGELTNVSNHINNLYQQIAVEAANNTVVTSSDTNILVAPPNETNPGTYNVSLAENISVDSVHAIEQITVGSGITLSGTDGVITAHAVNSDTVNSGLFEAGQTSMYNGYVSGLANTSWSPDAVYHGGYAATQEQLQEAVGYVNNNITKLKDNDIAEVRLSSNGNGGTVYLLRNVIIDGEHAVVPGTLSFASSGGVNGNKVITISSNGEAITLDAGSVVSANEGKEYSQNQALEDITINGNKYSVATSASVEAAKTVVQAAENKPNVFSVTDATAEGDAHNTYKVNVADMHVKDAKVTDGSNGALNGIITMKDSTTANIEGLHDYYTTEANVNVVNNNASVKFNRNDGANKYGFNIVGGSNIALGKDSDGAITISATDTNTQYKVEAANANKTVNVVNTYTFSEVDGNHSVQIVDTDTNKYISGGSAQYTGNDGVISLTYNDGTTIAVNGLKNTYINDITLNGNTLVFDYNDDGITDKSIDLSGLTSTLGTMSSWKAKVGSTTIDVTNGETVEYVAGSNISLSANGEQQITVATASNVTFDSVDVGDVKISQTGINAGNKVITNVADGSISQGSTDAVNGSQLYDVDQKVNTNTSGIASNKAKITALETEVAKGWTSSVNGTEVKNIKMGGTQNFEDGKNIELTTDEYDNIIVSTADEVNFEKVSVAGNGDATSVVIDSTGIDMGSQKITNVASGSIAQNSKDAVNGGQLWEAEQYDIDRVQIGASIVGGANDTISLIRRSGNAVTGSLQITTGGGNLGNTDHRYVEISNSNDESIKLITGSIVTVNQGNDDVVAQLHQITVNGLSYSVPTWDQIGDAINMQDYHLCNGKDVINVNGVSNTGYVVGSDGVVKLDILNTHKDDAAHPAEHVYIADVASHSALQTEIQTRKTEDDNLRQRIAEEESTRASADKELNQRIANEEATRKTEDDNLRQRIAEEEGVRASADKELNQRIANEESARKEAVTELNQRIAEEESTRASADKELNQRIANEEATRKTEDDNLRQRIAEEESARTSADKELNQRIANEESARRTEDDTLRQRIANEEEARKDNDIVSGNIADDGTVTLTKGDSSTVTIGTISDYALDNQKVKVGDDGTVKLTATDKYSGQQQVAEISDVASKTVLDAEIAERIAYDQAIIDYTDARANQLDSRINQLGSKVNKVGAGAAALAALHPMDFDPDDKLSFAVGAGNYAGETATALGAFYRPNEKVMMNVAGTYGNGENMVNMGVSFALDRTNHVSNSRTAMAKEIVDLREQVATQGQQIAQLVALVQQLAGVQQPVVPAEQLFPDVPENHWAYEYVNTLISKGIIEGYLDGTFGGDRTMTRYEFAAMLFRAMEQGVVLSEQIRQEFEKELGRVRVDRVKDADNDPNKIERVRVNKAGDRDNYGSKIVQVKH